MTEVKPATDEEIAVVVDHLAKWAGPEILPNAITRGLIARIEADRAEIANLKGALSRLRTSRKLQNLFSTVLLRGLR